MQNRKYPEFCRENDFLKKKKKEKRKRTLDELIFYVLTESDSTSIQMVVKMTT